MAAAENSHSRHADAVHSALAESELRLRRLVESALDAIVTIDDHGWILEWNAQAERTFGWSREEAIGESVTLLAPPKQREALQALIAAREIDSHGLLNRRHEVSGLRRDNTEIPLELTIIPLFWGGNRIYTIFARDITERVRAAAEARHFEAVIEAATNAIIGLDVAGTIVSWNCAAERIFGYTAQEVRGLSIGELTPSAEAAEEILARVRWAMSEDGKSIARRRDGSLFPIIRVLRPILGKSGEPIGAVVVCADVSAHDELQQKLANEEYLASLGRVAGRVSHEFNNVLMGILPFVELIERNASDTKLVTAAKHMRTSLQRGRQITDEIRFFTRASAPLQVAPITASELAKSIEDQVQDLIGTSIDLSIENKADDVEILCHSAQIVQAIINLVLNAKDAMPSRGRISVVFTRPEESMAEIAVIDTGTGMDEMTLSRIFEPLFTTKAKGTGLGLAIVKYIVDRHGGSIGVSSRAGEGTTFRIRLRAVSDHA